MSNTKYNVLTEDELATLNAVERGEQNLGPYVEDPTAIAIVAIQTASALRARAAGAVMADAKGS